MEINILAAILQLWVSKLRQHCAFLLIIVYFVLELITTTLANLLLICLDSKYVFLFCYFLSLKLDY
jgi:hypothetical protein